MRGTHLLVEIEAFNVALGVCTWSAGIKLAHVIKVPIPYWFRESPLLDSILVCRAKPLFEPPLLETPPSLFSICRGQGSVAQPCDQPCLKGRTPGCFRCLEVPLAHTFSVLSPYGPNRQAEMLKLPRSESWHFGNSALWVQATLEFCFGATGKKDVPSQSLGLPTCAETKMTPERTSAEHRGPPGL